VSSTRLWGVAPTSPPMPPPARAPGSPREFYLPAWYYSFEHPKKGEPMRWFLLAPAALSLALLSACAHVKGCVKPTDCPSGQICGADNKCPPAPTDIPPDYCSACTTDDECASRVGIGSRCVQVGQGGGTFCGVDCSNS